MIKNLIQTPTSWRRALGMLLFLALAAAAGPAQTSNTDGTTPAGLAPGAPAGSYALTGFENVNLFNGNLNFNLPLYQVQGRGTAEYTITLPIEQKWRVEQFTIPGPGEPPRFTPLGEWWGGLKPGYGPGVLEGRRGGYGEWPQELYCGSALDADHVFNQMLTRLTFTAADGTEFELRDQLTGGQPASLGSVPCGSDGNSRGTIFVTADGTAATFISDTAIHDYKWNPMGTNDQFQPSGYLLMRDGTRYRIDSGLVTGMRDRNGNRLNFTYSFGKVTAITDSLNRQITLTYASGGTPFDQLTFQGFGDQPRAIKIWKGSLGSVLRPGHSLQTYAQLFPEILGASSHTQYNPERVSKVELPNGRSYVFSYNSYGELARVVLPTGGIFEYDWIDGAQGFGADGIIYRKVSERRVYKDGATLESKTTYSGEPVGGDQVVEVRTINASGALLAYSKHYFYGTALGSMVPDPLRNTPISYRPWKEGREYQTESFDIAGSTPILKRKVEHAIQQPLTGSTWPLGQPETLDAAKPNDPQITQSVTTLLDTNQVAKQRSYMTSTATGPTSTNTTLARAPRVP
jgi:hypothetical protein